MKGPTGIQGSLIGPEMDVVTSPTGESSGVGPLFDILTMTTNSLLGGTYQIDYSVNLVVLSGIFLTIKLVVDNVTHTTIVYTDEIQNLFPNTVFAVLTAGVHVIKLTASSTAASLPQIAVTRVFSRSISIFRVIP